MVWQPIVELVTADAVAAKVHEHPEYLTEADLPDVSDVIREGDSRLTDARTPLAHDHPEYLTEADLPAPPDLSGYVTNNDPRLSDSRTPLAHEHPEYLTEADLPDVSDVIREGDARLSDARTPTAHGHEVTDVTGLMDVFYDFQDWLQDNYYSDTQIDNKLVTLENSLPVLLDTLPVLRYAVVTVPNSGWADSVTLSVDGLTGVHWVSPVTAADAATWAAGNWWASSPTDGQIVITGEIQPTADPVDIRVVWWGEKAPQ